MPEREHEEKRIRRPRDARKDDGARRAPPRPVDPTGGGVAKERQRPAGAARRKDPKSEARRKRCRARSRERNERETLRSQGGDLPPLENKTNNN